ncbi:MAG: hypothetical protein ACD_37C00204G0002 [uncultured bacterium]|nr:MAG: hypothetical protein ACD_37C00204G0002 [uncultured bacterium]
MLVDSITLQIKAGNGGNGAVSFLRNGQKARGGPDGGNGGNGGDIYFQGTTNVSDLGEFRFKKKIKAEDGVPGGGSNLFGKNAKHTVILLPLGTQVANTKTGETIEITDENQVLIAKGGKGGRGNNEFKSATNQTPKYAEDGEQGEDKILSLELKFIADIGFVGLPNAGKSSLLAVLTNAHPKIGDFPFTTIEPNVGMFGPHMIADIPGLIEGASSGKGLGIKFLKHIEKTRLILHCIDVRETNPLKTYKTVRTEFEKYNSLLLEKPEIILITKTDLVSKEELNKKVGVLKKLGKPVLVSSIYDEKSLENLKASIKNYIEGSDEAIGA